MTIDPTSLAWANALSKLTTAPAPSLRRVASALGVNAMAVQRRLTALGYRWTGTAWEQSPQESATAGEKISGK